jgi:hypothetical protein
VGCIKRSGGGKGLDMMCARCEARVPHVPSIWFSHIWWLYRLQRGKYEFKQDDLSIDERFGLAEMEDALEVLKAEGFK